MYSSSNENMLLTDETLWKPLPPSSPILREPPAFSTNPYLSNFFMGFFTHQDFYKSSPILWMAVRNILKGSKKMFHISVDGFNINIYFTDEIAKDCI